MMKLELIPLGINGFIPSHGRHTTSFLLLHEKHAILLDAGTGIARLGEPRLQEKLAACTSLDVVLSHYHLDHVVGLFFLSTLWPNGPVTIHGPARPFVESDPKPALAQLLGPPLSPKPAADLFAGLTIHPITEPALAVAGLEARAWPQTHPGGSMGLRFEDLLAYMTDRSMDMALARRARGVALLLHEVWLTDDEADAAPEKLDVHSSAGQVAEFARAAQPAALMPIHHHPARAPEALAALCRDLETRSGVKVLVPEEGASYPLP